MTSVVKDGREYFPVVIETGAPLGKVLKLKAEVVFETDAATKREVPPVTPEILLRGLARQIQEHFRDTAESRFERLKKAVADLYYTCPWFNDRVPVMLQRDLWRRVRDAAEFQPGLSPQPYCLICADRGFTDNHGPCSCPIGLNIESTLIMLGWLHPGESREKPKRRWFRRKKEQ